MLKFDPKLGFESLDAGIYCLAIAACAVVRDEDFPMGDSTIYLISEGREFFGGLPALILDELFNWVCSALGAICQERFHAVTHGGLHYLHP